MTERSLVTVRKPGSLRWATRCLLALAVFHLLMATLLYLNLDGVIAAFTGTVFAPNRSAAEGAADGGIAVHVVLAVICVGLARAVPSGKRSTRIRATVLMSINVIAGIAAMWLPSQTYLSPLGVAIALATLVLLWRQEAGPGR